VARKEVEASDTTDLHVQDFIACVRSRKRPAADVEIGHRLSLVPHLDAAAETIVGDPPAAELLGRKARKPWDLIGS
jgi:hypothetical protein